jgi:hypothetical protein
MGGEGMGGYGAPVEETIVNNYYDSPDRGEDVSSADNFQDNSGQDFDTVSDDLGDDFSDTGSDDYLA